MGLNRLQVRREYFPVNVRAIPISVELALIKPHDVEQVWPCCGGDWSWRSICDCASEIALPASMSWNAHTGTRREAHHHLSPLSTASHFTITSQSALPTSSK
jgi:hypothetical protein